MLVNRDAMSRPPAQSSFPDAPPETQPTSPTNMQLPNRPPYDPEVVEPLNQIFAAGLPLHMNAEFLPIMRTLPVSLDSAENILALGGGGTHEERKISGPDGEIPVSIFRPKNFDATKKHAAIIYYHLGGMIFGNRFVGLSSFAQYLSSCNAIIITPEYRLAPENPAPAQIEDAYATYKWVGENMESLNIDPERLMLSGVSGGGCLCAGVTLLARERGGPKICGQLLDTPMLDDRNETVSAAQFDAEGAIWSGQSNVFAWEALLGLRRGTEDVKDHEAPGRATDLSGLPPAYVECGSAEVFRDEAVAYASKLWEAGVQAELHVWAGMWHWSDHFAPTAEVAKKSVQMRNQWVERLLNRTEPCEKSP